MKKLEYKAPECLIVNVNMEGVLAASRFEVGEYDSNGDAIDLEF